MLAASASAAPSSSEASSSSSNGTETNTLGLLFEEIFFGYMSLIYLVVNVERKFWSMCYGVQYRVESLFDSFNSAFKFEEPLETRLVEEYDDGVSSLSFQYAAKAMDDLEVYQAVMVEQENVGDEFLSPLKLVSPETDSSLTSSSTSSYSDERTAVKDEWGHFADFQDELADESGFIPTCSRNPHRSSIKVSSSTLETLAEEVREDGEEEDWNF
jgi:hypothetical protein